MSPLILALPSKGRIQDETIKWLSGLGLGFERGGEGRGYRATLQGLGGAEVRLLSASEIADALESGTVHAGITGRDLLEERAGGLGDFIRPLRGLGFARGRLVVAVPELWLDVETISDLVDVAAQHFEKTRSRLRIATKFREIARRHFSAVGLRDYILVASQGATEGAPAAGVAELIVDLTETGATLAANHLRVLSDGVILETEATLAASLATKWSDENRKTFARLCGLAGADAGPLKP
jgi:ATP phosphoribosyltransferase